MKPLSLGVVLVMSLSWPAPADKDSFCLDKVSDFLWQNCDYGHDPVLFSSLEVEPVPSCTLGKATICMETKTTVPLTSVKAVVTGEKSGFWLQIPCLKNIGSCTYRDICETIDSFIPPGEPCPKSLHTFGLPCYCPFKKGTYSLPKTRFQIPPMKMLPSLSSGNYYAQIILSNDNTHLSCFKINVSLMEK
ncbi:ganglioside GM2 activator-like [Dromiciops gliroides]|uniref:ganglioside GM2 activator-like n=1 Tax=Dromiciops gliroides TaxID=33562 RepID=UPI001CC79E5B|nr:ganglioside GM2 activator-like [Dromiciops gliroides]